MSDNTISTPESLQFFFAGPANQEAINKLIEQKDPPADFSWNDLDAFYQAKLSANKTQYDFWRFMLDLWENTWGSITLPEFIEYGPQDYKKENNLENVWDNDYLCKYFYIEALIYYELALGCFLNGNDIQLYFYLTYWNKGEYCPSDNLDLSDHWLNKVHESHRYSIIDRSNSLTNDELNLSLLKKSADDAINAISNYMSI